MRYDGRYEKSKRQTKIETNNRKYALGSATIHQGDTIVSCAVNLADSQDSYQLKLVQLIAPMANNQELTKKQKSSELFLEQLLNGVLSDTNLGGKKLHIEVVVEQDDGSFLAVAANAMYLALQQACDTLTRRNNQSNSGISQGLAAIQVAFITPEIPLIDPDRHEELQALIEATVCVNEAGEFLAVQFDNNGRPFGINELNGVLISGTAVAQEEIQELKSHLYTPFTPMKEDKVIVIATGNEGKAREFAALFEKSGYQIKTMKDFPELPDVAETGQTFAENARLKAETIATIIQAPVLADDSGLKVDALGGLPGVYSARFAGLQKNDASNNAKLMYELTDVPDEKRTAQFHCTLALAAPDKETLVVEAEWEGRIGRIPRGDNGFGYDPLFVIDQNGKTAAELTAKEKNELSHRARAIKKLEEHWLEWLEGVEE